VHKNYRIIVISLAGLAVLFYFGQSFITKKFFKPTESKLDQGIGLPEGQSSAIQVLAENLAIPWEAVALPNGDLLVTQRSGSILRIGRNNQQKFEISGVRHIGEGGLQGLALHPDFDENKLLYIYFTTETIEGLSNRVERYKLEDDQLADKTEIISAIPGATNHDGGRIAFGPDRKLYVTTGDAGASELAQDTQSLAGKILRLNDDGTIPEDNPFENAIFSYGHRNPQGIAWDDKGQMWSTEHGPSGVESGQDEINLIVKGGNYGWPDVTGDGNKKGMISPVFHSGSDETWAPAGMVFVNGSLFFTGLRGQTLYEAKIISNKNLEIKSHFRNDYGRLRALHYDGQHLYMSTSNTDGRGETIEGDDKIIKINKTLFFSAKKD
jgi:aldose sugar dehydrogenase